MDDWVRGSVIFCQKGSFQAYLAARTGEVVGTPTQAAEQLRLLCGVASRRELATDPRARQVYQEVVQGFSRWASTRNTYGRAG